ncbi:MAG: hypothetical protein ACHQQQ_09255 [Bacteroidota bacterium]
MQNVNDQSIIPAEESRCIWMDAGIVTYKLCDRRYECDQCPFDIVFRQQGADQMVITKTVPSQSPISEQSSVPPVGGDDYFDQQLQSFLLPFTTPALPDDRLYYCNHMWVKNDIGDFVKMGIDQIAAQMFDTIGGVVLPQTPSHIQKDAPCIWLTHHNWAVALRTPLAGTIIYSNRAMKECPYLIIHYPYTEGWMLLLSPDVPGDVQRSLLRSDDAAELYRNQGVLLHDKFSQAYGRMRHGVGTTLNDGGTQIRSLPDIIGEKTYYGIIHNIFQVH